MARDDLYKRLGVGKDASSDVIKRAYLRLAKKLHPDVNRSPGAGERFLAVKEAYETLSNPLLRREYDERIADRPPWECPRPPVRTGRVIHVAPPYAAREPKSVRVRSSSEERRRRQLAFAYTAVTAGTSVVFLAGAFLLVALGGVLVLLVLHVFPFTRPR